MLKDARKVCDIVTVALQGDPTIDRPKKCKPVQSLEDRLEILLSLKYVDEVVTYNTEADLLELLKITDHDVRILGSDYRNNNSYTGAELLKPVYYHERDHEYSTTLLKALIYKAHKVAAKKTIE